MAFSGIYPYPGQILACRIEKQIGRELQREEKRRMGKT